MKNFLVVITLLFTSQTIISQENMSNLPKRDTQKNDLSINLHYFSIVEGININYDRVLNKSISIGVSFFKAYSNQDPVNNSDIDISKSTNFLAIPNIKYYVGKRFARRFYLQGLTMISSGKANIFRNNDPVSEDVNFTDVALGVGIGDKRILKNGLFIDFGIAIAYNLLSKNSPESLVHPNLSVGYRF